MGVTDNFARVRIDQVVVEREKRQRRVIETKDLEQSISQVGLLQPITITQNFRLMAGERRLTACKALGHETIMVRFFEDLDPIEAKIVETEENIKRKDLEWKDLVSAVGEIHDLYVARDPLWTMTDTGRALSLTVGTISMYLTVHEQLGQSRVAEAGSVREAYNVLVRREARASGDALEELLAVSPLIVPPSVTGTSQSIVLQPGAKPLPVQPPEVVLNESFRDWAPAYSGPKFNFIHCDFPYGKDFAAGPQARGAEPEAIYDDSPEVFWTLFDCLLDNLDNIMSLSAHLLFWYAFEYHHEVLRRFEAKAPSLKFYKFPLVWFKSDNAGVASDVRFTPRHVYETCLLARRSDRQLAKPALADLYPAPKSGSDHNLHPSAKPEPMLRHFFQLIVDETTTMLDPTCGAGSALRAADSLRASRVLGLEIDAKHVASARTAFKNARVLRGAAAQL